MRYEFAASVPRVEQLLALAERNRVGRKHNHKPNNRAIQRKANTAKKAANDRRARMGKKAELIRAYWRGERETNPAASMQ